MQVAGEGWNGGHADYDFEWSAFLMGADDAFDDCGAEFVADGVLGV